MIIANFFFQNSSVHEELSSEEKIEELQTKTENLQVETENFHVETENSEPDNLKVETENLQDATENLNNENTIQSEIKFSASDFNFLDKAGTVEESKISGNFVESF